MGELTVKRWTRYGKDRLYVNLPDGGQVGWVDLRTGDVTLEREDLRAEFEAAIAGHTTTVGPAGESPAEQTTPPTVRQQSDGPAVAEPETTDQAQEPVAVEIAWRDLTVNKAGQQAREQAVAERQRAPVRIAIARLLGVHTDERAWRIGADGEERVAARLERLPDGWHVLHALPIGDRGADIDHFVVGPGGAFTVNAKHHPQASVWVAGNTFLVNGQRQPYVRNSRHEAARAAKLLSAALGHQVEVTGLIAVVGAHKGFTVKEQPDGVHVVARKRLTKWLLRQPPVLADDEVAAIFAAARRSDTWR